MKKPQLDKLKIPAAALAAGLIIGLVAGQVRVSNEQKICQEKIKEKDKKMVFMQKKLSDEKAEATGSLEQRYQDDVNKLQTALQGEKRKATGLTAQAGTLTEQVQKLEARVKSADETTAKTKQSLEEAQRSNKELDKELKKITGEKQALQADLKKTTKELGTCTSNNAELSMIAEELVKRYKNKGIGAVLLEKEPLTQVRKVELEQLTSQYREEIEQKKINKK
jgi:chromosome segregation ATPase